MINSLKKFIVVFLVLTKSVFSDRPLIESYGYKAEEHYVETEDGYILSVFRVANPGKPCVFLQHGVISLSTDWLMFGPSRSLGFQLANAGYDVWLGNTRGNAYSRRHKMYSTNQKQYWDFSFHEMGMYDLPAMINYTLSKTQKPNLHFIGHSEGTAAFFVMASMKKEMNDKIRSMTAISPVSYLTHTKNAMYRTLLNFSDFIYFWTNIFQTYEYKVSEQIVKAKMMFEGEFSSKYPVIPRSCSLKDIYHYSQIMRSGRFQTFDHGYNLNMHKYGQSTPLQYNISAITVPIYIYYSDTDETSDVQDVLRLAAQIKHSGGKLLVRGTPHDEMMWNTSGRNNYFYKIIIDIINQFEGNNKK